MADSKITALTALTAADPINDMFPVVDVSDTSMAASGTTKRISVNNILSSSPTASGALTVTGLVTAGSATITGDLTAARLIVTGGTIPANGLWLPTTNTLEFSANSLAQYRIAPLGVFSWYDGAGGTRMTLNSTGLGVGGSPTRKLSVSGAGGGLDVTDTTQSTRIRMRSSSASNFYIEALNSAESAYVTLRLNDTTQIDASGNCGIGVTPSAWRNTQRALQIGAVGGLFSSAASTGSTCIGRNVYESAAGDFTYIVNDEATFYEQTATGTHAWYTAAAGTGIISFGSAKMTLDASGNLLVGTTDTSSTSGAGFKIIGSGLGPYVVNAASTNAALAYTMYSTGAAAYRFYVGWGGTVFATNTTISAISDARLKENVQDIDVGLGAILALKPRKFDWKAGKGKDIKGDRGFIAQEFEQVFPQLVDEWADPAPEGEAPYKSVRQDLIPVLVKAIQELTARVQTLETR